MSEPEPMLPAVRSIILDDLKPVRPLPSPSRRTARVTAAAALLAVAIPLVLGVRSSFGWLVASTSVMLMAAGICSVGIALWDAIPGRNMSVWNLWRAVLCCLVIFFTAMFLTAAARPLSIPPTEGEVVSRICSGIPAIIGLPILALAIYLIFRAYPVRPVSCGGIAGLGCGVIIESGWRAYCPYSAPIHILTTHALAVAMLSAVGAGLAWLCAKVRGRTALKPKRPSAA